MALKIPTSSAKTAVHLEHEQKLGQNHIDKVMAYMPWKLEALTLAYGISYVDESGDGMKHQFSVEVSGEDGTLLLREIN